MVNPSLLPRQFLILAIVLPLAVLLGYLVATPDQFDSIALIGLVVGGLLLPIVLRWHHPMLIFCWNATMNMFFLPGKPSLWIVLAGVSFGISVVAFGIHKRAVDTYIPSIAWSLLAILGVVLLTAKLTGGLGLRSAGGSSYGGKNYFLLIAAVLGYFALTSQRVPLQYAARWTSLFFASILTAFMSNFIYLLGPFFYFLYAVFPVDFAMQQAMADFDITYGMKRFTGLAMGGPALIHLMLLRYGLRGIFSLAHPWRFLFFAGCVFLTTLGGFRSSLLMLFLLFTIQFFLERLHRTRLVFYLVIGGILVACLALPFATHLPLSVQRSLSFLPVDVDPIARVDAQASTVWRVEMWKLLWPEVPRYLLLGKGCSLNPTELYLLNQGTRAGYFSHVEEAIYVGAYHNGPLTLLIPFGGFAAIAFLWFAFASLRVLYCNYRESAPELRLVNTFLLSYFTMRLIYYLFIYGHFAEDFFIFTGIIGLAVSINGNHKKVASLKESSLQSTPLEKPALAPT